MSLADTINNTDTPTAPPEQTWPNREALRGVYAERGHESRYSTSQLDADVKTIKDRSITRDQLDVILDGAGYPKIAAAYFYSREQTEPVVDALEKMTREIVEANRRGEDVEAAKKALIAKGEELKALVTPPTGIPDDIQPLNARDAVALANAVIAGTKGITYSLAGDNKAQGVGRALLGLRAHLGADDDYDHPEAFMDYGNVPKPKDWTPSTQR